jgi:phage terminase small subunit
MSTTPAPALSPDGLDALKRLKPKVQRFCYEYVIDFNGTQAAIRAGYRPRSARVLASQFLAKPNIQAAVSALAKRQAEKLELTAERVITEVCRIGFADVRKLFDEAGRLKNPKDWDDDIAAAVESYDAKTKTVRLVQKNAALALATRIAKIVDSETVPPHMQGNFVVVCPADATPDQWTQLARAHQMIPSSPHVVNAAPSLNGSTGIPHAHHNGDGE